MAYIFISYRRQASSDLGNYLKKYFEDAGLSAYLDVAARPEIGSLDAQIRSEIEACTVFICLLDNATLASEWVRREIEYAHELNKLRIPVMHQDFIFPTGNTSEGIDALLAMRGETIYDKDNHFIEETVQRLITAVRNIPLTQTSNIQYSNPLRVLIVEDDPTWVEIIKISIGLVTSNHQITETTAYSDGLASIRRQVYDLVILDIKLDNDDEAGLKLAKALRAEERQEAAGMILFSIVATVPTIIEIFAQFRTVFSDKNHFKLANFTEVIQKSIRDARWYAAEQHMRRTVTFTFQFHGMELRVAGETYQPQIATTIADFSRNDLNNRLTMLQNTNNNPAAPPIPLSQNQGLIELGNTITDKLLSDANIHNAFIRALSQHPSRVSLSFLGGIDIQQIPFEALQVEGKLGALSLPITRKLQRNSGIVRPFSVRLFQDLHERQQPLNIMIVGAKDDPEALRLHALFTEELGKVGLVKPIIFIESDIESMLSFIHRNGIDCKMLHVTHTACLTLDRTAFGHLATAFSAEEMPAFVYLNAWMGKSFWDIISSFAKVGSSSVVSYQFQVDKSTAISFSEQVYLHFFETYSISQSVHRARKRLLPHGFESLAAICIDMR